MNPEQAERNRNILKRYIPEQAAGLVSEWIYRYDFKLKIKKSRTSKYGDYRPPFEGRNHQITINHDLNPYAFLLTLVHEVAHLGNFNKHGESVAPHGREWKHEFKVLMQPFFAMQIFPEDVQKAIERYLYNPAATSCSDLNLQRVLKQYDAKDGVFHLECLEEGALFRFRDAVYRKGRKQRKRYMCTDINTEKGFLFSPVAEIEPLH